MTGATSSSAVTSDQIRDLFSTSMSMMYRQEVPQYGTLVDLVEDINRAALEKEPALRQRLEAAGQLRRLGVERHGAIRVGSGRELAMLHRIFRIMGMHPVGYYDLSVAGVPVHSTAFRPVDETALRSNPFRLFTSLLRLDLIADPALRRQAQEILDRREIFTPRALALTARFEEAGGFQAAEAAEFVREVTQTFRWHRETTVSQSTYRQLSAAHRLVADVVCFRGPHINHLTPRTLDIDEAHAEMPRRGIAPKELIEGPPRRKHAILLRQTSFKALEEPIAFPGGSAQGGHTARFGEIEQRGVALTRTGRALYDRLLDSVRVDASGGAPSTADQPTRLAQAFQDFPDDLDALHDQALAFFRYRVRDAVGLARAATSGMAFDLAELRRRRVLEALPIVYEDFLPVSAAGIFQSNLGGLEPMRYEAQGAKEVFEAALQGRVADEIDLYERTRQASLDEVREQFEALRTG